MPFQKITAFRIRLRRIDSDVSGPGRSKIYPLTALPEIAKELIVALFDWVSLTIDKTCFDIMLHPYKNTHTGSAGNKFLYRMSDYVTIGNNG